VINEGRHHYFVVADARARTAMEMWFHNKMMLEERENKMEIRQEMIQLQKSFRDHLMKLLEDKGLLREFEIIEFEKGEENWPS